MIWIVASKICRRIFSYVPPMQFQKNNSLFRGKNKQYPSSLYMLFQVMKDPMFFCAFDLTSDNGNVN